MFLKEIVNGLTPWIITAILFALLFSGANYAPTATIGILILLDWAGGTLLFSSIFHERRGVKRYIRIPMCIPGALFLGLFLVGGIQLLSLGKDISFPLDLLPSLWIYIPAVVAQFFILKWGSSGEERYIIEI